jgi:hypothetical protein
MKKFKIWLAERHNKEQIVDTITAHLGLDKQSGQSTPLDSFDPDTLSDKIKGLGFWNTLSAEKQNSIEAMIRDQRGTIADIVREIEEVDSGGGMQSLSPPQGKDKETQTTPNDPQQPSQPEIDNMQTPQGF